MLFNSIEFLLFFILFITSVILYKKKFKFIVIIFSSFFYAYWSLKFLMLLYFIILTSYYTGLKIHKSKHSIFYLFFYIFSICLLLFHFKYGNYLPVYSNNFDSIILPIGISFYIFQSISYIVDIYKKKIVPTDPVNYIFFIIFFPQIISGPILRAKQFLPQINKDLLLFSNNNIKKAIILITWGYFLKVGLADNADIYTSRHLESPLQSNSITLIFSIFFYGLQIYSDFFGYTLIAIGIAKLMGLNIPANFNKPYHATSFQDFWKRWHISLSKFFRDYLYIPLGGNKRLGGNLNVLIVMTLAGAWHGSSIFLIIWGFAHGSFIVIERYLPKIIINSLIYRIFILFIIFILWIPFKINDWQIIKNIFNQIIIFEEFSIHNIMNKFLFMKIIFFSTILISSDLLITKKKLINIKNSKKFYILISSIIFITILLGNLDGEEFIYFRF